MLHLPSPAPAPKPWRFDVTSALIGAGVTLLLAGLAYRNRNALRLGWEGVVESLVQWRDRLRAGTEGRYRERVAAWARSAVVPGGAASLDRIFVEPQLLPPEPAPQTLSEVETAPLGPRTLPLRQTLGGYPRLAILGTPGAGRTTLLAYVALACSHAARAGDDGAEAQPTLGPAEDRLPLYVPLPAMDWSETGDAVEQDREVRDTPEGVGRLIHAAVNAVGGSGGMVSALRQRLEAGEAVVLADGWDELSPPEQRKAGAWLAVMADALPGNLWLVSAGIRGYAALTEAGFVPLPLVAWDVGQVETFARRWLEILTPADKPTPAAIRNLTADLQWAARAGAPPLELALRAWVLHADGEASSQRAALFDRALDLLLWQEEEPWLAETCRAVLGHVALSVHQDGRATTEREEIDAAIESVLPPPEERPTRAAAHVFQALTGRQGLLRLRGPNRYAFAHPVWQAYLTARQLVTDDPTALVERLDDVRWDEVLRFYAELGDMGPLVTAWLRRPGDMFQTHLHRLSSWVHAAPDDVGWRNNAMAILARSVLHPGTPGPVRRALAEAVAMTGAPGLNYFFKQAIQHADAEVRAAAAVGLTRTASESDLPTLEAVLEDESATVREAVVRGLAHVGIDATTRWLAQTLACGDETLSPIAAEALVQCGEEGAAFLRQAAESGDVMARRAAVFGLAHLETRDLLGRIVRQDEQWIVRSAAEAALEALDERELTAGVAPPLQIEKLPWLVSWAAAQGEGLGVGDAARQMLWRAMSEGDAPVRLAAAQALVQAGCLDDVKRLRNALSDQDPRVANAALEALSEISRRYDLRIE